MISVIVPIYNPGSSLTSCIDSILASTYRDFELILVNDGSTDGSLAVCREFCQKDSRVRLIDQENQGASVARNKGLESSRGEWVVFVDADDIVFSDYLSIVAKEPSADLLIFDYTSKGEGASKTTSEDWAVSIPLDNAEDRADLIERLLRYWPLSKGAHTDLRAPWAKAYRRSVLERHSIRFTPGLRIGEDALFNIEFFLVMQSCDYIPVPVYWHRKRVGSVSRGYDPELSDSFRILQRGMRDVLEAHGMLSLLEQAYAANTLENMAFLLIKGIFSPYSTKTAHEERVLCEQMREDEIYEGALRHNLKIGNLPRRAMLGLFQLRRYRAVKVMSRACYAVLEQLDKRSDVA